MNKIKLNFYLTDDRIPTNYTTKKNLENQYVRHGSTVALEKCDIRLTLQKPDEGKITQSV